MAAVLLMGVAAVDARAQDPLEQLVKQRISQETGLDQNLLATLFIDDGRNQIMLAFVFINEKALQSNLKPDLKTAISPYVGKRAMLALAVATRESAFDPTFISFEQDLVAYPTSMAAIVPITEDFRAGLLQKSVVSAGIILLNTGLDVNRPFAIKYSSRFSTTFSLTGEQPTRRPGTSPTGSLSLAMFFQFLLLNLIWLLLFPILL